MIQKHLPKLTAGLVAAMLSATPAAAGSFQVHSPDLQSGHFPQAQYANQFGCTGSNVSPEIDWSGTPAGTKSLVVTLYDPDAPTGSGWWHWVVVNIPPSVTSLPRGVGSNPANLPSGASQITGDAGTARYFGPCPPVGQTHRYVVTVNALKVDKLTLPANATPALVGFMVTMNSLGKATMTATAGR